VAACNKGLSVAEEVGRQIKTGGVLPTDVRKPEPEASQEAGVTRRAIVTGICLSVGVSLLANSVRYIFHGSYMAFSHMPMSNLILFLLALMVGAVLARWLGRRWAFSPTEWITVFCMGFASTLGPT
jgi:hypothetical protein